MTKKLQKLKNSHLLGLFFIVYFFIINAGFITNADVKIVYLNAKNIVERGSLYFSDIDPNLKPQTATLPNGKVVARPSIFLAIFFIPLLIISKLIHFFTAIPLKFVDEFLISQINVVIGTLAVVVFHKILPFFGMNEKDSIIGSLIFGLLSMLTIYSKLTAFEPIYILLLLSITWQLLKYRDSQNTKHIYLSSVLFSLMFLFKTANFIFAPVILLCFLLSTSKGLKATTLVKVATPVSVSILMTLLANYIITDNPFQSSYGREAYLFTKPLWEGLREQIFSLEYGILIYSPLSLIGFLSFLPFARRFKNEAIFLGTLFLVNLLFHSTWFSPKGGEGVWGPRFLAMTEFVLFIPLSYSLQYFRKKKLRLLLLVLILVTAAQQSIGLSIYSRQYYDIKNQLEKRGVGQKNIITQFRGQALLLLNKIKGGKEIYDLEKFSKKPSLVKDSAVYDQAQYEAFQSFNFWFLHVKKALPGHLLAKLLALLMFGLIFLDIATMVIILKARLFSRYDKNDDKA